MDKSTLSSNGTITDQSPALSGIEPLNTTNSTVDEDPRRTHFHSDFQRAMASIPGGPPMGSGSPQAESNTPARDQSPQAQAASGGRPRGSTRVQLFREQQHSGSPDGAASVTSTVPVGRNAPPPDIVQIQRDYRQQIFGDGGKISGLSFDSQVVNQQRLVNTGDVQSRMQDIRGLPHNIIQGASSQPEGQEMRVSPTKLPGGQFVDYSKFQRENLQQPPVGKSPQKSNGQEDFPLNMSNAITSSTSENRQQIPRTQKSDQRQPATTYNTNNIQIVAPVDGQAIQIPEPSRPQVHFHHQQPLQRQQLNDPEHDFLELRLSPDELRVGNDSVESGMYVDQDLSGEFLPLENEDPEGAQSSSQSNEDELEYEDNTEVDQDVVLQPEADQTSYDENDEVSRQVQEAQQLQGRQGGVFLAGGFAGSNLPQANILQTVQQQQQHQQGPNQQYLQISRASTRTESGDTSQDNGNTFAEEDQLSQQELQAGNLSISPDVHSSRQVASSVRKSAANNHTSTSTSQSSDHSAPPSRNSMPSRSSAHDTKSDTSNSKKQPIDKTQNPDVTKGTRATNGTNNPSSVTNQTQTQTKQQVGSGAIAKVSKVSQQQSQTNPSVRRNKIRTVPPKTMGVSSTKVSVSSSKSRTPHGSSRGKHSIRSRTSIGHQQPCPRAAGATKAKSPSRAPPQRLAPSGGDSTASTSQPQGQGSLAQVIQGQYMLPGQQVTYQSMPSNQAGMYFDSSANMQVPSRDQNRDGADGGILRPNPIGETDSGQRVFTAPSGHQGSQQHMIALAGAPGSMYPAQGMIPGHMGIDGDGDEDGASGIPAVISQQFTSANHNPHPIQASYRSFVPNDRQVAGLSFSTPQDMQVWINPSVQTFGGPQPISGHQQIRGLPNLAQQPQIQPHQQIPQSVPQQPLVYTTSNIHPVHALGAADSTHISAMGGGTTTHQNYGPRQKPDFTGAWDRSLELSPISRTSGATDRIQVTSEPSPSPSGSGGGRVSLHDQSLDSSSTERTMQNESQMNNDIVGMEQLRGQIHSMLKMTSQVLPDKNTYDQTSGEAPTIPISRLEDETTRLSLTDALSDLDMESMLNIPSRFYPGTSGTSATPDMSSLLADKQNLQQTLEKEKFRRKHCEKQIGDLQSKVLELQQQLAVAVSTDRKKDIMIEQLDKTLAQLVDGWKKKETDKQKIIQSLQEENTVFKTKQRQQQEVLERFEHELTETVDQLAHEQQRSKILEEQHLKKISQQQEELTKLSRMLETERQQALSLDADVHKLTADNEHLTAALQETRQRYEEDKDSWDDKEREYLQKMEEITENHLTKMDEEKTKLERQTQKVQELQNSVASYQNEIQKLQMDLDTTHREKESLKVQIGLLEAKSESQLRKLEADLTASFEKQVSERCEEEHQRALDRETDAQERHRRQVLELTQRHQTEADAQLQRHQGELWRAQDAHKREQRDRDDKIELLNQEIEDLKLNNKRLEQQRSEITLKLQSMMQAHCNEALRLLQIGSQALTITKDGTYSSLYSGIQSMRDPNSSSQASSSTAPTVMQNTSMATTTVTMLNLRPSILEAATRGESGSANIERYLHSLDQPQSDSNPMSSGVTGGNTHDREESTLEFRPLSELLNQSMTSDLTQILIDPHSPPSNLDASHMTSVSMVPARPQYPPSNDNVLFQHDESRLMSLVQSLPTAQNFTSTGVGITGGYSPKSSEAEKEPGAFRPYGIPVSPSQPSNTPTSQQFTTPPKRQLTQSDGKSVSYGFASDPPDKSTNQSTRLSTNHNEATIMLHPPVQRDQAEFTHNASGSSGSGTLSQITSIPGEKPARQNTSMNTTASSDWGYPTNDGAKSSLLSHILQQHLTSDTGASHHGNSGQPSALHEQVNKITESPSDLSNVTEKFDQHETRQNELQHYIRMLLQRSPGNTDEDAARSSPSHSEDAVLTPTSTGKVYAFSKSTVTPPPVVAPGGPVDQAGTSVTTATSAVQSTHRAQDPLGSLSPQQVGEISRLLGLYGAGRPSEDGTSESTSQPPVQELLAYLKDLQARNENLSSPQEPQIPTRDKKSRTPPQQGKGRGAKVGGGAGGRQASPTRPGQGQGHGQAQSSSKVKKNLEQNYAPSAPGAKHVIKIPSAVESSHSKPQPSSRQPPVSTATKPPAQQPKAASNGPQVKKTTDRKSSAGGKQQGKGTAAWK